MFNSFMNNPNLQRLDADIENIQAVADTGALVIMIYKNKNPKESGHIAFVGNSNLKLYTDPAIPRLQGKTGKTLDAVERLVLVQAGKFSGTTSIVFGTNEWRKQKNKLLSNWLYFYTVKRK